MSKPIKIITWNVNGIRACFDKGLPQFVAEQKADILCLQETKAHIESVEPEAKTLGYKKSIWSSAEKKGYSGVALYTNLEPLMLQDSIGNPLYDNEGRIVRGIFPHFDIYNFCLK